MNASLTSFGDCPPSSITPLRPCASSDGGTKVLGMHVRFYCNEKQTSYFGVLKLFTRCRYTINSRHKTCRMIKHDDYCVMFTLHSYVEIQNEVITKMVEFRYVAIQIEAAYVFTKVLPPSKTVKAN